VISGTIQRETVVPDMTFTVCLGREGKLADEALERSLAIVSSQVSVQRAAVGATVWTLVTLVRRRSNMQCHSICTCIHIHHSLATTCIQGQGQGSVIDRSQSLAHESGTVCLLRSTEL